MIDNYDSFTFNLVRYLQECGCTVSVFDNDKISINEIRQLDPSGIIISPGPGRPEDAGITMDVINKLGMSYPILGVCLGHQAIAAAFGSRIILAEQIMHGKTSQITHSNDSLFLGLRSPFTATRYHSLVVDPNSISYPLSVIAWANTTVMAIKHCHLPLFGVQFHPESILTEYGHQLLRNFIRQYTTAKSIKNKGACIA